MKIFHRSITFALLIALLALSPFKFAVACGPSYVEPIYEFDSEPDPPIQEYVGGKIGIVKPTFGYKSLAIAYRYLNGGGYSAYEQQFLVEALRGTEPEGTDKEVAESVKAWLETRKQVVKEEKQSDIYTEREIEGYNFFPNCTKNAFDVAKDTLIDRAGRYGYEDRWVAEWVSGQDNVFGICSSGTEFPKELGPDAPAWLKKDRDYQTAAAYFYSLNFDEARRRFEAIAKDDDSVWQETADYLVARTLVRQASITGNAASKLEIYGQVQHQLEHLLNKGGKFSDAAEKLLGLVKFRTHPEERLKELSEIITYQSGDDNLRQDVIDYAWLMDKFKSKILNDEQKRQDAIKKAKEADAAKVAAIAAANTNTLIPVEATPTSTANSNVSSWDIKEKKLHSGEIISLSASFKKVNSEDGDWISLDFAYDASLDEIFQAFARKLARPPSEDDRSKIKDEREKALAERKVYLGANFRFSAIQEDNGGSDSYYGDEELRSELVPSYLRSSDLTDWTVTLQTNDDQAYVHSLKKWHDTHLYAWLVSVLSHANTKSPELAAIITDAEKVNRDAPAFPSVAYHLVRLKSDLGKTAAARKLVDEVLTEGADVLPASARNQFLKFRMKLSENLSDFLKFSTRKPVTYYLDSQYGTIADLFNQTKSEWNKDYGESQEEFLRETDDEYRDLLPWDNRVVFDEQTADILNRHFSLDLLVRAVDDPALPDYLRDRLTFVVWTRAVLLGRQDVSVPFAKRLMKTEPEMAADFGRDISARTIAERRIEELWLLLKNPQFTPFVVSGIPTWSEREIASGTDGWWQEPPETDYDNQGNEFQKPIERPPFITVTQSDAARKEKARIIALGNSKEYLSGRVFEWAARDPKDARIPEALYIVATVNAPAQYVEYNELFHDRALKLLNARYPHSPWTAKAQEEDNSNK